MCNPERDTDQLLRRAQQGDRAAEEQLMERHRSRLRRMVAVRLDPRVSVRVDPSDIVQEALVDASQQLNEYLRQRPLPFYPWLRQLAWRRLVDLHHRHVTAKRRSVELEAALPSPRLPDESAMQLARQFMAEGTSPSARLMNQELQERVQAALERLPASDREVLILRHLEQMSISEIASLLEISESAVKMRRLRAMQQLRQLLELDSDRDTP